MSTYISAKEASKMYNISEQRIRTLCRTGKLKSKKIGNSWVIDSKNANQFGLQKSLVVAEDHGIYEINKHDKHKKIALSFFSGAMGLDLGIEKSGFEIKLACELDKYCRQTITLNRPNVALIGDINNYSANDILKEANLSKDDSIDLIFGGPPCQAFSTAGKRQSFNDERGNVFLKYIDLAIELQPKFIVIENVRGLLSTPLLNNPDNNISDLPEDKLNGGALNFILRKLKISGYSYSFNLYNSANFGSPQIRERVIIICSKNGIVPPFLEPTHSANGEFGLPKWKTLKETLKGLKEHHHLNFPEKRLQYYRLLKSGQNWKNLPIEIQKEAMGKSFLLDGGKTGFFRRLDWDKPSPTLVTHPAMPATDLSHPDEDRPLSIEEYKRIQEFPDNWKLSGPLIQQYKQIGNAVPLSLGNAVGNLIIKLLNNEEVKKIPNFNYSRYKKTSNFEWEEEFNNRIKLINDNNKQIALSF